MSTPRDIYFTSFFYRHFITGGKLDDTPPPTYVRLKTVPNSKVITPPPTWWMDTIYNSESTRTGMDTSIKAIAAPPHSGPNESAASTPPNCSCCGRDSGDDHKKYRFSPRPARAPVLAPTLPASPTSAVSQAPTAGTGTGYRRSTGSSSCNAQRASQRV